MRLITLLIFAIFLYSCGYKAAVTQDAATSNEYARGFVISKQDEYTDISISNSWKGSDTRFEYIVGDESFDDLELKQPTFIDKNINSVICLSTTHVAYMDALGLTDKIVAVSNGGLIYNEKVREGIESGKIIDLGNDNILDYEHIVNINADIILAYAIDEGFLMNFDRLRQLNQRVVVISEYMEPDPLGQSEWIKVYGSLFGKTDLADSIFSGIEASYNKLSSEVGTQSAPSVFCNIPWKEIWYAPGGESFTAKLIADAGGNYIWKSHKSEGSLNFDFETVLHDAMETQFWLNTGNLTSLEQIKAMDSKLEQFQAYKDRKVYNPVKRMSVLGGNDFYESGALYSNLVLRDLIQIFSGDSIGEMHYYKRL